MKSVTKRTFAVPTRAEVSPANQAIFDKLQKNVGFVPNLCAYFGGGQADQQLLTQPHKPRNRFPFSRGSSLTMRGINVTIREINLTIK